MLSTYSADTIKTTIKLENPKAQELFQTSNEKIDFNTCLNYSIPSLTNTKTDLSLNSISFLNNDSLVNTKNKYPFTSINQKVMAINKNINEQKGEKMFLPKKTNIYFNIEKNCKKNSFLLLIKQKIVFLI